MAIVYYSRGKRKVATESGFYFQVRTDLLHRIGGPAVIHPNEKIKEWWVNGKLHRTDGPAVEWLDGKEFYYIKGIQFNYIQYKKIIKWI